MFATTRVKGTMRLVVLEGRRPRSAGEIAFAPTTMRELHTRVGDHVRVGSGPGARALVVGKVLLPATSHTDYDQSGWMTATGARRALGKLDDTGGGLPPRALARGCTRRGRASAPDTNRRP